METSPATTTLLFQPPVSFFSPSFWEELYRLKLNVYRLDVEPIPVSSIYRASSGSNLSPFEFDKRGFQIVMGGFINSCAVQGQLLNVNTREEFRDRDKKALLESAAEEIWQKILDGSAIEDPSLLNTVVVLSFADLKSYQFTYWVGIPAILHKTSYALKQSLTVVKSSFHGTNWLCAVYKQLLISGLTAIVDSHKNVSPIFAVKIRETKESTAVEASVSTVAELWEDRYNTDVFFVFFDQSASSNSFGWTARNFLALLSVKHSSSSSSSINLVGLRFDDSIAKLLACQHNDSTESEQSLQITHEFVAEHDSSVWCQVFVAEVGNQNLSAADEAADSNLKQLVTSPVLPRVVGWESNERGKPGPRAADLSNLLDGKFLMAQAVDLNLKLMKWRMWPELNTERLASTRCLLLGSGTLGCAVARSLLGWGVRNVTFVDSGIVSYSNPARQCLFEYSDCENHSFKATAAAEHLKRIFPDVISEGVVMTIPMPGHPVPTSEAASADHERNCQRMQELICAHDVCFVLTDSREARWLPTILCASYDKLLINIALGFDSYVVMRHGSGANQSSNRLGCYFCNDVVAARNSQKDRTLDQMCTVTRPGLSFIAAALGVEVMVEILHSEYGVDHPAPRNLGMDAAENETTPEHFSGTKSIPHQIRGTLNGFSQFSPEAPAFDCCTACSQRVVDCYRSNKYSFIRDVCNDSKILETVSGVANLLDSVDLDLCVESDEEF